jgi:hypothetical protein
VTTFPHPIGDRQSNSNTNRDGTLKDSAGPSAHQFSRFEFGAAWIETAAKATRLPLDGVSSVWGPTTEFRSNVSYLTPNEDTLNYF